MSKTDIKLIRKHYPCFMAELDKFKQHFKSLQLNHIKTGKGEIGNNLTGNEINPVISGEITGEQRGNLNNAN